MRGEYVLGASVKTRAIAAYQRNREERDAQEAQYLAERQARERRDLMAALKTWWEVEVDEDELLITPETGKPYVMVDGLRFTLGDPYDRLLAYVPSPCGKDHWIRVNAYGKNAPIEVGQVLATIHDNPCDHCEYDRKEQALASAPRPPAERRLTTAEQLESLIRGIAREAFYELHPEEA